MALSRITQGLAGSFTAGYAVGDLIVILSANLSAATVPSTPSGYTLLTSATQAASSALAVFWKVATSTSETYPTITNSSDSVYAIYRGQHATPFVGTGGQSSSGASTTISYSGIASFANPANDWVLTFAVSTVNGGAMPSFPPTAQTLVQNSSNFLAIFDSNSAVSSYSFNSKTLSAASITMTKTTELQVTVASTIPNMVYMVRQAVNRASTY